MKERGWEFYAEKKLLNPAWELRRERLENLERCFSELESYKRNKLKLQYPVFFVPGWTSEDCTAWKVASPDIPKKFRKYYLPARYWIEEIISNKKQAHFITFTDKQTKSSPSFIELGKHLKRKVLRIANGCPINLVGHSMGGLDIRAAVLDSKKPFLKIKNVVTVGTPNNGERRIKFLLKIKKYSKHHKEQGLNMHPRSEVMKIMDSVESRIKLLRSVEKFYVFMGMQDSAVMKSPKLNKEGISNTLYKSKVKIIQTSSAKHSGEDGITQDPRIFLPIIKVLCGIRLRDNFNYGYFKC